MLALRIHPESRSDAVAGIDVDVTRPSAGALALRYIVNGAIRDLALPPPSAPVRTDELWRHTCFEVFIRAAGADYCEFNFAPSTQWAAYEFSGYRAGMKNAAVAPPRIEVRGADAHFELRAALDLPGLANGADLAISAVIEEANGAKSYWALAHPPGRADFHHGASFAYKLPAPERR